MKKIYVLHSPQQLRALNGRARGGLGMWESKARENQVLPFSTEPLAKHSSFHQANDLVLNVKLPQKRLRLFSNLYT